MDHDSNRWSDSCARARSVHKCSHREHPFSARRLRAPRPREPPLLPRGTRAGGDRQAPPHLPSRREPAPPAGARREDRRDPRARDDRNRGLEPPATAARRQGAARGDRRAGSKPSGVSARASSSARCGGATWSGSPPAPRCRRSCRSVAPPRPIPIEIVPLVGALWDTGEDYRRLVPLPGAAATHGRDAPRAERARGGAQRDAHALTARGAESAQRPRPLRRAGQRVPRDRHRVGGPPHRHRRESDRSGARFLPRGAVASVGCLFLDARGRPCASSLDRRTLGITHDQLRACPRSGGAGRGSPEARRRARRRARRNPGRPHHRRSARPEPERDHEGRMTTMPTDLFQFAPGREGYYGEFGGAFVPEILHETLAELRAAFDDARRDPAFWSEYVDVMSTYSCRPTPLTYCENLTRHFGGARIYVKREDLNHTGAHKANNVMGQGLLVKRMGKRRVIAETGAGQHGVATATMAARFGLACTIYMGEDDVARQRPNVFWMEQLGARGRRRDRRHAHAEGRDQRGLRDWAESMDDTHYVLGTVCGPHPFPQMVTYFQSIIGQEARAQMLEIDRARSRAASTRAWAAARTRPASSRASSTTRRSSWSASRPAARASTRTGTRRASPADGAARASRRATRASSSRTRTATCTTRTRWPPGLDYIGVGPILAHLHERGRVRFEAATDAEVVEALRLVIRRGGPHPGARERARLRHGLQGGADAVARRRDPHQPVRPRRQGHLHGRRRARRRAMEAVHPRQGRELRREGGRAMTAVQTAGLERHVREAAREEADPAHDARRGRLSVARRQLDDARGDGRRRRGPGRAAASVQRADRRRPVVREGQPGSDPGRNGVGHVLRLRDARLEAVPLPAPLHGLLQQRVPHGRRRASVRVSRTPGCAGSSSPTCRRKKRSS